MRILILMTLCISTFALATPSRIVADIEDDITTDTVEMPRLKKLVDKSMGWAMNRAKDELIARGESGLAYEGYAKWHNIYHETMFGNYRQIGDHDPLFQFLSDWYEKVEAVLTREFCIRSHISIIKSFNNGIPVTFHPCTFDMGSVQGERVVEYTRHFSGGPHADNEPYQGVVPEVAWAATEISCMAAGGSMLCPVLATLAEKLMDLIAPHIAEKVYAKACS